jgi:hypothetical protein
VRHFDGLPVDAESIVEQVVQQERGAPRAAAVAEGAGR